MYNDTLYVTFFYIFMKIYYIPEKDILYFYLPQGLFDHMCMSYSMGFVQQFVRFVHFLIEKEQNQRSF